MVEYKLKNGNILKDGHTMFLQDVVSDLKRKAYLEDLKSKTDGGATVPCSDGLASKEFQQQILTQHVREYIECVPCSCKGQTVCWKCTFRADIEYLDAC